MGFKGGRVGRGSGREVGDGGGGSGEGGEGRGAGQRLVADWQCIWAGSSSGIKGRGGAARTAGQLRLVATRQASGHLRAGRVLTPMCSA